MGDLDNGAHPYFELESNKEVIEKVVQGYRLKKPGSCPDSMYLLLTDMWKTNPEERPTFTEIKNRLVIEKRKSPSDASINVYYENVQ